MCCAGRWPRSRVRCSPRGSKPARPISAPRCRSNSIAACVIGGVSLRGGIGRVGNVVLGAIFIGLIQNGMDLAQIQSYLQEVVIGVLLILAVIADQLRQFVMLRLKD